MSTPWESIVVGVALLGTMAAYALFAGADFGGGIWDLLAGSTERGERPREAIDRSVTPVWEGNQTWIVLGIVFVWTAYPSAFAAIMTSLFIPLSLSLLGILLRGIGFAFRHEAKKLRTQQFAGVLFAASSFLAPFFLGAAVGAVSTGRVRNDHHGDVLSAWVNAVALVTGALFVATCAFVGGMYLIGDSHRRGDEDMAKYFHYRTIGAGVVSAVLAFVNLLLMHGDAPYVFHRLIGPALPFMIVSVAGGAFAFVLVVLRKQFALRIATGVCVVCVVGAWGFAQYPYLLPTSLSLAEGSAPTAALLAEFAVIGLALLFVAPAFVYLYWLQQHERLAVTEESDVLEQAGAAENRLARTAPAPVGLRLATAVVIGVAGVDIAREGLARLRRLRRDRTYGPGIRRPRD